MDESFISEIHKKCFVLFQDYKIYQTIYSDTAAKGVSVVIISDTINGYQELELQTAELQVTAVNYTQRLKCNAHLKNGALADGFKRNTCAK